MKINYTDYKAEQLLQDDYFISSMLNPTEDTEFFWEIQVEGGSIDKKELMLAKHILQGMQVRKKRMESQELFDVWKKINNTNIQSVPRKKLYFHPLFVAASILLLVGCGIFFLWESNLNSNTFREIAQSIKPNEEIVDVQLVLSDEERISIQEEKIDIQYDKKGDILVNAQKIDQERVDRSIKRETTSAKKINQLIVPKGRRSTLTFSDGTVLWVNAGSRVVYPEQFDAKRREIYIDGEAYLKVSPDQDRPFIVKTHKIDVRVLGTTFNIMAYEEDEKQTVALVEGNVEIVSNKNKIAVLTPNDLFQYAEGQVNVEQTDISNYISWVEGWYIFESEQLSIILERLIRYYGKEIEYRKEEIEDIRCSGKLDLKSDLRKVLDVLIDTAPINYEIQENNFSISYKPE